MSTTTVPFLRPMSIAELLDATIRLYRKNFLTFVAIVAVIQVPLLVINGVLNIPMAQSAEEMVAFDPYSIDPETYDPDSLSSFLPPAMGRYYLWLGVQLLVTATLGMVGTSLMTGALAWAVSERHMERPATVGSAYRAVGRRWKSLLGATLLTLGVYVILYIVFIVPCVGQIVGIPALIFAYVCLRFVPQSVMLEDKRAGDSLRRSWFLTKPHFWRVAGIVALLFILGILITAGPSYLVSFGIVALEIPIMVQTLITTVVSALLGLLYLPIRLTGETVIYYDLRVRSEGLDLELELDALAAGFEEGLEEELFPELDVEPATPSAHEPFLTGRDWRNLAILFGVGLGIALLCCLAYFGLIAVFMAANEPMMERLMESLPTMTPVP